MTGSTPTLPSAQYPPVIPTMCVHWMFTEYSLNVPWMFTEWPAQVVQRLRAGCVRLMMMGSTTTLPFAQYPECSLNVPCMFPVCSVNVPWMFTECSLNVPWVFTECSLVVTECPLSIHCMFTEGSICDTNHVALVGAWGTSWSMLYVELDLDWLSLNVHWMFTECSLNVHWLFTEGFLNFHWTFTACSLKPVFDLFWPRL
jgi:hypothetical protein